MNEPPSQLIGELNFDSIGEGDFVPPDNDDIIPSLLTKSLQHVATAQKIATTIVSPSVDSDDAMDILKVYYDQYTLLRIFGFFGGVIVTFILAWAIPTLLQKIFRDSWGLEINYNSNIYKEMYRNKTRQYKQTKNSEERIPIYVTGEYKRENGIKLFLRTNLFSIFYLLIRMVILFVGLLLSLLIVRQDFVAVVTSLGIGGFVALMQLSVYFSNIFAHFWIIFTGKVNLGDVISVGENGPRGMLVEFGVINSIMLQPNPNYVEEEEDEEQKSNYACKIKPNSKSLPWNVSAKNNNNNPQKDFILDDQGSLDVGSIHSIGNGINPFSNLPSMTPLEQYSLLHNSGLVQHQKKSELHHYLKKKELETSAPFCGKYMHTQKKRGDHLGFNREFIELQLPNYDLVFLPIYILKE